MAETVKITAPSLGGVTIEGIQNSPETVQFRGLRYALIEKRYDYPKRIDSYETDIDATKYGAIPPQPFRIPSPIIPKDQLQTEFPEQDEFACLNLNITRPVSVSSTSKPVPVMVWIFPGANTFGSAADKSYDPTALVARSASKELPIIFVNLNYRLSLLGYVYVNGRANHSMYDQTEALIWVKNHISDFGGDPSNITLVGESAGSLGTHYHSLNPKSEGLFRRIGLMSTVIESRTPFPLDDAKALAAKAKSLCGVETDAEFAEVSVEKLMDAVPIIGGMYGPVDDGGWLGDLSASSVPYIDRSPLAQVEAVMLGNTRFESIFYAPKIGLIPTAMRHQRLTEVPLIGVDLAERYNITAEPDHDSENLMNLVQMYDDISYGQPVDQTVTRLRGAGVKTYHYLFDEPNPYDPSFDAHHGVDVLYFFNSFKFDKKYDDFIDKYQTGWIRYAYGLPPWDFLGENTENVVMVDQDLHVRQDGEYELRRRTEAFAKLNEHRHKYDAYNITKRFLYV
ncbi:Alpha/Beta hydrolase protein [Lipomyces oligophaga]|uniref:Alpha/Beta hydrolase protein n=1 Tax=Lipomyces oligophaga TaxID=45792 RepID=UPI0034CED46E